VWRGEFFGAFADADVALAKAGWHLAYVKAPDLFGSPAAVKKWEEFHAAMVNEYGLHDKPGLIGLSRGGLYCLNWAAAHPDKTLAVYLDNAVCDFKSWPGGGPKKLGTGKGSEPEWKKLLAAYDFKTDADAIAYKLNPVDNLEPLAKAKLPLLLVYGDQDAVGRMCRLGRCETDARCELGGRPVACEHESGVRSPAGRYDERFVRRVGMTIDGVSQSTGVDRVVGIEAAGEDLSIAVTDRSRGVELGRAVLPADALITVLSDRPAGAQAVANGVTVEVRRNEVWLVVGGAEAAVGLDDLTDAVGSVAG
jgi:hypothetical protein